MDIDVFDEVLNDYVELMNGHTNSNVWFHNYDFDQKSGYPSDSVAANLSKTTTRKELINVENVDKQVFKKNNINLLFGPINSPQYAVEMLNAPSLHEVYEKVLEIRD